MLMLSLILTSNLLLAGTQELETNCIDCLFSSFTVTECNLKGYWTSLMVLQV